MAQTQFITHAPIAQPPSVVPRRGSGLFSALLVVLIILVGAGTGGLYMLAKNYEMRVEESKNTLADLQREIEVSSIQGAQSLQQRIQRAQQLLDSHVYPSQVLNFLEDNTLGTITYTGLQYSNGVIRAKVLAPGYVELAQQIRHFRGLGDQVASVTFTPPRLNEAGGLEVAFDVALQPTFIHSQPTSRTSQPPPSSQETKKAEPKPTESFEEGEEETL